MAATKDSWSTVEGFIESINVFGSADTQADNAPVWGIMDALLAEAGWAHKDAPPDFGHDVWPEPPFHWDISNQAVAEALARIDVRGRGYGWGVYALSDRGAAAVRRQEVARALVLQLLDRAASGG